jgi:hypothetical protein
MIQRVKGGQKRSIRNHASILKREAYLGSYVGGVPHVPKILLVGQLDGFF